ncbi:MAG: uroporphyrinogen decarboxylase family protein [Acetatifactor sp.]
MSTKRELVLKAFHNEKTERIPVGFWYHFLEGDEFNATLNRPELLQKNLEGHKKFKEAFEPDFVKIMTDGLFFLPYDFSKVETAADLKELKPLPEDHPFYQKNEELVKGVREIFGPDILLFFNEFSPFNQLLSGLGQVGRPIGLQRLKEFLEQDGEAVAYALDVLAESLNILTRKVVRPGLADGIYLSVNNPNRGIPAQIYSAFVAPSEIKVLETAKSVSPDNILHICGFAGNKNILSVYKDYPVEVVNWAVHAEELDLAEGKKFFGGKAVIGGFDNVKEGLLYSGTREEIEQYVEKLLADTGKEGVIIGADCTVPSDIDIERLKWVREKAAALS